MQYFTQGNIDKQEKKYKEDPDKVFIPFNTGRQLSNVEQAFGSGVPDPKTIELYSTVEKAIEEEKIMLPSIEGETIIKVNNYAAIQGRESSNGNVFYASETNSYYLVQANSISGYTTDEVAVHSLIGGNFAVLIDNNSTYDITHFGAIADNGLDDRAAIIKALDYAIATEKYNIFIPSGSFNTSKYIYITTSVNITGVNGSIINYQSADETIPLDGIANIPSKARSLFFIEDCDNMKIENITAVGQSIADISVNYGYLAYVKNSKNFRLINSKLYAGGSIFNQEKSTNDTGAVIDACYSYNNIQALHPGKKTSITNSTFEKDESTVFDRIGDLGSSHGIYAFAGSEDILISNCQFINIRTNGVKFSGSGSPIRNIKVINCIFTDCGVGLQFGADDNQYHTGLLVSGCTFIDCGTNRVGWNQQAGISLLGSDRVTIRDCDFIYTKDNQIGNSIRGIKANRFTLTSQPISNLIIKNVKFFKEEGFIPSTTLLLYALDLKNINQDGGTQFLIENVTIDGVAGVSFIIEDSYAPILKNINIKNSTVIGDLKGCAFPEINNMVLNHIDNITDGAALRIQDCAWPTINNVTTVNISGLNRIRNFRWNYNLVDDGLIFPQMDKGFITGTQGLQEIVFAYGSGWETGDTITVSGTTFTYNTDFTSISTLIAAINTLTNISCDDYGSFLSVVTNHIRIKSDIKSASNNVINITKVTNRRTAGIILKNPETVGVYGQSQSKGASLSEDKLVIWSPSMQNFSFINLIGNDLTSSTFLSNGFFPLNTINNASTEIELGANTVSEVFRYLIQ